MAWIAKKRSLMRRMSGFTLLEMLVVLVILGLMAGLVGPRLFAKSDESKVKIAEVQIKMIKGAIHTLRLDIGRFPSNDEGLKILYHPTTDDSIRMLWKGPYLDEEIPLDPWGRTYRYSVPGSDGQPFALYSLGADGERAGHGIDSDIGYLPPLQ